MANPHYKKAYGLYREGQLGEAEQYLRDALAQGLFDSFGGERLLALILCHTGREQEAARLIDQNVESYYRPNIREISLVANHRGSPPFFNAILFKKPKVAVHPVPKSGSSSVKALALQILGMDDKAPHETVHSENLEKPLKRSDLKEYRHIAFIRDPISRFLSFYYGSVLKSKVLQLEFDNFGAQDPRRDRLDPSPDLPTFIDRFEEYYTTMPIVRSHLMPSWHILGKSFTDIGILHRFSAISQLPAFLGIDRTMPVRMSSASSTHDNQQKDFKPTAFIEKLYSDDWDLMKQAAREPLHLPRS